MALDSIKIYTEELTTTINPKLNCTLKEAIFINGFNGFKFKEDPLNPNLSYYYANINEINIKYSPYIHRGELRIKFNIPKLLAGINVCSIYACNIQTLFERLSFKLWPLIDLLEAPHLRSWKVSSVEYNIDIILDKHKIDTVYSVLKKTSSTTKFRQALSYDNGGKTLYFIPVNAKFKSSDVVIKVYYKLLELKECNSEFNVSELYGSRGIVNLSPGQDILRIEITKKRDAIYKDFNIGNGTSNCTLMDTNNLINFENIGTFEQIINIDYQYKILNEMLEAVNLNKIITTRMTIKELIYSCDMLSSKEQKEYWNVIQHENIDSHKKKPDKAVRNKCIKSILESGYNYIYVDFELEPILIKNIIKNLPEVEQFEMALYKKSNINTDYLLRALPNRRIYKGRHY